MRTVRVETETVDASAALASIDNGSGRQAAAGGGSTLGWGGVIGAGFGSIFGSELDTTRFGAGTSFVDAPVDTQPSKKNSDPNAKSPQGGTAAQSGWRVVHVSRESEPDEIGLDGKVLKITRSVVTTVERYRTIPSFPVASPGGATTPGGIGAVL